MIGASAGITYSLIYTTNGGVFSFGFSRPGALGHGEASRHQVQYIPKRIEYFLNQRVIGVSAWAHSLVWTDDGRVFSFGAANYFQLGFYMPPHLNQYLPLPRPINMEAAFNSQYYNQCTPQQGRVPPRVGKVVFASAGAKHSVVVTDNMGDGGVFTFGSNKFGQLGIVLGLGDDGSPEVPRQKQWAPAWVSTYSYRAPVVTAPNHDAL